jgi:beta-galactosidase
MFRAAFLLFVSLTMAAAQPRVDRIINTGWVFIRGDLARAALRECSETGWENVTLPHTWNRLDGQDGGNNYYRGAAWYRKHLEVPSAFRGKSLFLKFDGASTAARVFVNGKPAGEHRGGFGAFCVEITSLVETGRSNTVAVRVTNARDTALAPLGGDFTVFGGIYRSVHLLVLEQVSISPLDDASPGVYVRQERVDTGAATASVSVVLRNATGGVRSGVLRCVIRGGRGAKIPAGEIPFSVSPGSHSVDLPPITVNHPRLWRGRDDPFLYRADVTLVEGGEVKDRVIQPLGFRFFRVDPEKGFSLNGKPYPLRGVNRHQDREDMGWAIGWKEQAQDFRIIADMGCTAVRLCHYQHAQEFYDLCDTGGIVAWAELALVDEVHPSAAFAECCRDQLRELIKQNFNHPSILFWSLSNELIPDGREAATTDLVVSLNALARSLDSSRYTTLASRGNYDWSLRINTVTDVIGYNLYKGWYEKMPEDFGPFVDALHSRLPGRPLCISEYGAGAGIHQHEYPAKKPAPGGPWHPEEWQSIVHETTWKAIETRPWIWGAFVWTMFDFASDGRSEGELPGRNDKGLVTYDRKVKKDAYFWYRANWNPAPLVYITGKRFSPRPPGPSDVKVYSNCDSVSLFVNGVPAGVRQCSSRIALWHDVELAAGKNSLDVRGEGRGGRGADSCVVICGDQVIDRSPRR